MQATEFPIWAPRDLCALHKRETVTQSKLTKCELSLRELADTARNGEYLEESQ